MVKNYTDQELLNRVKSLASFKTLPKDYWLLGIRSKDDQFNTFDDKFYLWNGDKFVLVCTGTTNAGANGLKEFDKYGAKGTAHVKSNEWYYDVWQFGWHKGKVEALKQVRPFLICRDADKDNSVDENEASLEMCGINFHPNTYDMNDMRVKTLIGGWSLGCQVANNLEMYKQIINKTKGQKSVTYCLLSEF